MPIQRQESIMSPREGGGIGLDPVRIRRVVCALSAVLLVVPVRDEFDWTRDTVFLTGGKQVRGVVIDDTDEEQVVLLLDGGKRKEFPRSEVERVDKLRDRLAMFLEKHRPGLSPEAEWQLALDAQAVRLPLMARIQAWHVLVRDPEHEKAHEFLGHTRSGDGWKMEIDKKKVSAKKFEELSRQWKHRLVLESEHFVVESDCGLQRTVELLFDLEGLYVWWMHNLGKLLHATEDVDDPRTEKMTFFVHKDVESFVPVSGKVPYYDASGEVPTTFGGRNVVGTFYDPQATRPREFFELAAQALIYSTLAMGEVKGETWEEFRRNAAWVELGLASWVAQHASGPPGYASFREPMDGTFRLEWEVARKSLEQVSPAHVLHDARHELTNLIGLSHENFVGNSADIPLCKARCASFVSFLIEVDPPVRKGKKAVGSGRSGLWYYLREVYGTPRAHSSNALDDGFGGGKVETLESAWKAWTNTFSTK